MGEVGIGSGYYNRRNQNGQGEGGEEFVWLSESLHCLSLISAILDVKLLTPMFTLIHTVRLTPSTTCSEFIPNFGRRHPCEAMERGETYLIGSAFPKFIGSS